MSTEQKLKEFIMSRYSSMREFSIALGMPYSTIDSIFKRGLENASVANIIKICNHLSISADELAEGRITSRTLNDLSPEEAELVRMFRMMNKDGQTLVMTTVRTFAGNPDMQKESTKSETA